MSGFPLLAGLALAASVLSLVLTRVLLDHASRLRLLDLPNARSSHTRPTPRGGGVAIVVSFSIAIAAAVAMGGVSLRDAAAVLLPGWAVAAIGLLDDLHGVRPMARLGVHLGAGAAFLGATGGVPPTGLHWLDSNQVIGTLIAVLVVAWAINFFNFMDGIDGIAGSEAIFVSTAMAIIALASSQASVAAAAAVLSGSVLGFLVWNWPPARIFMGDVGSGFVGFVLSAIALLAMRSSTVSVWTILILPGVFLADATVTLVRRAVRRERVQEAHRSHAYQWLSRQWGSHLKVTLLCIGINVLLISPVATVSFLNPSWAGLAAGLVLIVLAILATIAGAGTAETADSRQSSETAPRTDQ